MSNKIFLTAIINGYNSYLAKEEEKYFFNKETRSDGTSIFIRALNNKGIKSTGQQVTVSINDSDLAIALFNYAVSGGGLLYDEIKNDLEKTRDVDSNFTLKTAVGFIHAITSSIKASPEKTVLNKNANELLLLFPDVKPEILFEKDNNFRNRVFDIARQSGNIEVLDYPIMLAALKTSNGGNDYLTILFEKNPSVDHSKTWLALIKNGTIAADARVNDQTFLSYWRMQQEIKKPSDLLEVNASITGLIGEDQFRFIIHENQARILSMPYLMKKTPLQLAAMGYKTSLGENRKIMKDLITYLIQLPVSIANEQDGYWIETLLDLDINELIQIAGEIDNKMLVEFYDKGLHTTLINQLRDPWTLTTEQRALESARRVFIQKIVDSKNEQKPVSATINAKGSNLVTLDLEQEKRLAQANDAQMQLSANSECTDAFNDICRRIRTEARALSAANITSIITGVRPDTHYVEQLKWNDFSQIHSAYPAFFVTNTALHLVKLATNEKLDSNFYQDQIRPILLGEVISSLSLNSELIYPSIRHSIAQLVATDSLYHTDPHAMVDGFIYLHGQLKFVLEKFGLKIDILLEDANTKSILNNVYAKMLLCATYAQAGELVKQDLYSRLKQDGKLKEVVAVDAALREPQSKADSSIDQDANRLKNRAQAYANNTLVMGKTGNHANARCAAFIRDVFTQTAAQMHGSVQDGMEQMDSAQTDVIEFPLLRIAKSMLKIINYRISGYKDTGVYYEKYEKAFFRELVTSDNQTVALLSETTKNALAPYKPYFIEQMNMSLNNLGPIDYTDIARVKSLKDSLDLFFQALPVTVMDLDKSSQLIYLQLQLFYLDIAPDNANALQKLNTAGTIASAAFLQMFLSAVSPDTIYQAPVEKKHTIDTFLDAIIRKASGYYNNAMNQQKAGNTESLNCARFILEIKSVYKEDDTEDAKKKVFAKAIMRIISYRILSYMDKIKYDKSLYKDPDGFKAQLQQLDSAVQLHDADKKAIVEYIKTVLQTPGLKEKQDIPRTRSLALDLDLFNKLFDLKLDKNILVDCGYPVGNAYTAALVLSHPKSQGAASNNNNSNNNNNNGANYASSSASSANFNYKSNYDNSI